MTPEEVHELIQRVQSVRDRADEDKKAITSAYPGLDPLHDARITTFAKLINVLSSVQLSQTFIEKHLLDRQWWQAISREEIADSDVNIYVEEFLNFAKLGFVQGVFIAVESSLRILLRELDPNACNGGMAEFKSVYDCLISTKLASPPQDYVALLDLLRMTRNTIHNNGVYFHPRGRSSEITWRANTYTFNQGNAISFATWSFLMTLTDAVRQGLRVIVEDSVLRAVHSEIRDPFSYRH